jgi:predicted enzyme related to lactoylglutathione lyase
MSNHPIVHIEFSSQDRAESAKFYGDLFGWKTQDMPEMNYTTFDTGNGPGGGFNPTSDQVKAGDVFVYVATDDIEATLAKAESLGGRTVMPKTEIPETGWLAMFTDPTGNVVGLYTGMEGDG